MKSSNFFGLITLSLLLIVGCAAPVTFQSDPPRLAQGYVHDILDKLIGKKKEKVLDELGDPIQVLYDQTTSYYIYSALGDDHKILFITWWPAGYTKTEYHYCLSLEFNNEDVLQKYTYLSKNVADNVGEKYSCEFISIEGAKSATVKELLQEAKRGVSTAQYQIYKHTNHPDRLQWLCRSAEQGYWRAQWVLGYLHYYGSDGVHKSDILSFVWYRRVESGGKKVSGFDSIRAELSHEQLIKAEHLISNWQPGQCEKYIHERQENILK